MKENETYPIIGMSPGNSYFKDEEVRCLLKEVVERYGRTGVLIADVPAISTYLAFGYPENRARTDKAIAQGNAFKNRTARIQVELGYAPEQVRIVDWADEVENNPEYQNKYKAIRAARSLTWRRPLRPQYTIFFQSSLF
jgi:tRNA-dependent cyclodipeptide synthase